MSRNSIPQEDGQQSSILWYIFTFTLEFLVLLLTAGSVAFYVGTLYGFPECADPGLKPVFGDTKC
jgi:hypothetical protein